MRTPEYCGPQLDFLRENIGYENGLGLSGNNYEKVMQTLEQRCAYLSRMRRGAVGGASASEVLAALCWIMFFLIPPVGAL